MRLIEKILISFVILAAAYLFWLSPLTYLVAAWPTPTVMIMVFAPVLLFFIPSVILRFLPDGKTVCSAKVFDVSESKKRIKGYCTFQIFAPNHSKVGRFTQKSDANECVESLANACLDFCGNLTEPGGSTVNTLIVNFGPIENFDEVHLPFAATQTLALVACDNEYLYKQRQNPKMIENLKN